MRSPPKPSVLLALLVPLWQAMARPALASEPEKPWRAAYDRCQKLSGDGDYTGALQACEQAYAFNPDPGILAYIAQIQTALLHPVQAREALERYLRAGPIDSADRKTAEAQLRYLESQISTLSIVTHSPGGEVRVDDQPLDAATLARGVQLVAGAHRVTLQVQDETFTRFVFLRGGERQQLELPGSGTISLSCAAAEARFFIDDREVDAARASQGVASAPGSHRITFEAGNSSWPAQSVTVAPDQRVTVVCAAPTPVPARPAMNPRGYWVTGAGLAVGVAALTTAIYNGSEYNRWQTANDDLRDSLRQNDLTLAEGASRAEDNDRWMESIKTRRKVAIGLGVASALVTAGGVALIVADSATRARSGSGSWFRRVADGLTVDGSRTSGEIAWRCAW